MSHTENFPRKAFETACHAMGVLEQNREYLQFHLKNADEKTQQALVDMQRGAARLERAMSEMEDLLALHDPPPARRWMDLRDVLAQAEAMGPEIARALGLTLTVAQPGPETPCTVLGSPDSAEKICFHLLSNALRASDAGGTVTLTLEAGREGWTLTVADRGCGLPQEANRQENRRRFVGGAGAGLQLCRGLCAQLGWTLALEPNPGGGTLARVQIPAEENAEAALPGRVELCAQGERKNTRLRWLLTRECYLLEGTNA